MRPTLLITSNHTIQPLWVGLSEFYDLCIVGQQAPLATDMGLEGAFPLVKYVNPDIQEAAINESYRVAAKLHEPEMSGSLVERVSGASEQLQRDKVGRWWPAFAGERVRQIAMLIGMIEGLIAERQVAGCIVHEDVTPEMRAMVMFCKARGIPTIHIPHANCFYVGEKWDIHTESIADYIAASGTHAKEFYEKWGYKGAAKIVGSPQMDKWYGVGPTRKESREVLGIGENDFVIIFATSWWQLTSARSRFDVEYNESLQQMLKAAKEMKATLVIKMHPGESQGKENFYVEQMKASGVNGCVTHSYNEYVLRAGDVLISHGPSNICVEAAILGLPCGYFPTEDFGFDGGPIAIDGQMDVVGAIETTGRVVAGKWDSFAHRMNDVHDSLDAGTARERTVDFIREVCSR